MQQKNLCLAVGGRIDMCQGLSSDVGAILGPFKLDAMNCSIRPVTGLGEGCANRRYGEHPPARCNKLARRVTARAGMKYHNTGKLFSLLQAGNQTTLGIRARIPF